MDTSTCLHKGTRVLLTVLITLGAYSMLPTVQVTAFSCAAPSDGSVVQLCDGFDTSPLNMTKWFFSGSGNTTVTTATARSGAGSARFYVDPQSRTTYRDEIVSDGGQFHVGQDYCIHYSVKAENWTNIPESWAALFQTHMVPGNENWDCIASRNSISLAVQDTNNQLELRVVDSPRTFAPGSKGGALSSFIAHSTPFVQNQWYDYTFRYKPSFGSDGILEAWLGNEKVFTQRGGNIDTTDYCGVPSEPWSYIKIGIYKDTTDLGTQTSYADNVMIRRITNGGTCGPLNEPPAPGTPPTTCTNLQTTTASIPTGYGAAYNPLTTTKEYLVSVACTGTTQATVTVGNSNTTTYVYNKGYYYSGTTWTPYTLTCASGALVSNTWCPGKATASIPLPQNPQNVIAYTCQYTNSTWKCGCRDSVCTTAYWQLQRVQR